MRFVARRNSSSRINLTNSFRISSLSGRLYEMGSASPVKRDLFFERVVKGTPGLNRFKIGGLELVVPSSRHISVPQKH